MSDDVTAPPALPPTEPPPPELPQVVLLVTSLGTAYALEEPYPDLPESVATPVPAVVAGIQEDIDTEEPTGAVYLVRGEGGLPPGYVWRDRVWGSAVATVGYRVPEAQADEEDAEDEDEPTAGIDVRRVVQRVGGVAIVYEVNRTIPEIPGVPAWLRGRIKQIFRTTDGIYRARVVLDPSPIFPPGSVFTLHLSALVSALEVLTSEEADKEESEARQVQAAFLDDSVGDDEDGDGDGDEEASDD